MIVEAKLGENRLFVDGQNFPRFPSRVKGKKHRDKTTNDVSIAVTAEFEDRVGAIALRIGNEPHLARAAPNF